jgi:hypothetical protein
VWLNEHLLLTLATRRGLNEEVVVVETVLAVGVVLASVLNAHRVVTVLTEAMG